MFSKKEIEYWIALFTKINEDVRKNADPEWVDDLVVPLTDVDYYAEQIFNITGEESYKDAYELAWRISLENEVI